MSSYENFYRTKKPIEETTTEQLAQLMRVTFDGDLISKSARDELVKLGFTTRSEGFNMITPEGIRALVIYKIIH